MYNEKYRQVHWLKIKYCSEKHMKKFKINVQGYGCILLCLILCIMILLPIPVSAQEDRSKVVRVGWYEELIIPQKQTVRGEATATNTSRQ